MRLVEFRSGENEIVRGVLFEPGAPPPHPALVLVHGFLSTHAEFGDYPEKFCQRGYLTLAIDLRGHGASDGMRGLISEERMVQDLQATIDFIQKIASLASHRIALFGHSLGGAGVICTATRDARVRAIIAAATVNNLLDEVSPIEMQIYRLLDALNRLQKSVTHKSIYVPYRVKYKDIFQDEQARQAAEAKGFLQPTTPVDNLRLLMKQNTTSCARRVRVPALVARAELDRVVKLASAQRVFDAIASDKEWYEIKGSGHSFQTDCRGADAFEHIAAWLDAHLM